MDGDPGGDLLWDRVGMTPVAEPYGIHWFRRDLRLVGNPALSQNLARHPGRVLGIFCFDRKFLARPDFSAMRFDFFLRTLRALAAEIRAAGGDLLFVEGAPESAFREVFAHLARSPLGHPKTVSWNRDYEPFARDRDARLAEVFERHLSAQTITERDHLLIEPTELSKEDPRLEGGGFYQVYTPFRKKWETLFRGSAVSARLQETHRGLKAGTPEFSLRWPSSAGDFTAAGDAVLETIRTENEKRLPSALKEAGPRPGHGAAMEMLRAFRDDGLENYADQRDFPARAGTSKLSVYLKNGSLTVPQVIAFLELGPESPTRAKYFQELIWREFYYHILYHCPRVETEPFLEKYRNLEWRDDEEGLQRWCEGRTGFPIVDAGMRQLNATGWMHNRVRMIVASFLTKDLLIDYRWGERYFMEKLLDGDLAPNNGGWQWAASTGCDPQPYFRIFNPTSQGKKFDPEGEYVRHWVPELRDVPSALIHEPRDPIVDHAKQREAALGMFKRMRTKD